MVRVYTPANIRGSAQQDEDGFDIKNSIELTSEDDHLMGAMPGTALAANAPFGQILTRMGAESVGEVENSDGEIDMAPDGIGGFLGENAQEPALLEFPEEGVFDQAAQVIEVDDGQGVIDGQAGQEDLGLVTGIDLVFELGDDNGVDGVAFEISPITMLLVFFITILVIAGQVLDADQLDMSGLFLVFSGAFSGKNELVIWFLLEKSAGIGGDVHIGLDGDHEINPIFMS